MDKPTTWYAQHTHCPSCNRRYFLKVIDFDYVDGFYDTGYDCEYCGWRGNLSELAPPPYEHDFGPGDFQTVEFWDFIEEKAKNEYNELGWLEKLRRNRNLRPWWQIRRLIRKIL